MQLIEATIAAVKKNGKNNKINDIIGCEKAGFTKLYIYYIWIESLRHGLVSDLVKDIKISPYASIDYLIICYLLVG